MPKSKKSIQQFQTEHQSRFGDKPISYNSALRLSRMAGFDDAWAAVDQPRDGEPVSTELRLLLRRVYSEVLTAPVDLTVLKESLTALLEYLSGQGRTNANCWAVDMFFCLSEGWERDWTEQQLPDDFHDVLALMGQALHDTVRTPKIAENFDCLPEQLLARVRRLLLQHGQ
jgi:hypothetical protein